MSVKSSVKNIYLKDAVDLISGRDLTKAQYNAEGKGIPYIMGASNIKDGKFIIERWTNEPTVIGKRDDIILSVKGTVGQFFILSEQSVHLSRQVMALRVKKGYLNGYIKYFLSFYMEKLKKKAKGMIPGITREDILFAEIPDFELDRQESIVNTLNKITLLIDKRKAQIEALTSLAQSLFLDNFGDPVCNTKEWTNYKLTDICAKITDGTHDTPKRLDSGIMLITGKNIKPFKIDYSNIDYVSQDDHNIIFARCNPEYGDILYTNIGVNLGTALMNNINEEFSMKNVALLKLNKNIVLPRYLEFLLNYKPMKSSIIEASSSGGAQKFLSLGKIKEVSLPIPPIELQVKFSNVFEEILKQKSLLEDGLTELESMLNSLTQKAFKGEFYI
ncbi:restriction endonuclease subunit S [Bacillus altitudinis]|uniref:restriction endonuclease subunit S n=1 Tax=Bacillus altitudinis TaxID=293387 RepID=UPI0038B573B9